MFIGLFTYVCGRKKGFVNLFDVFVCLLYFIGCKVVLGFLVVQIHVCWFLLEVSELAYLLVEVNNGHVFSLHRTQTFTNVDRSFQRKASAD